MAVPTNVLRKARENAGIKQGEMALRLGVSSNSVISRLEKSESTDWPMAQRYLKAIGTPDSLAILEFYSWDWKVSKRPDFRHPDREALWAAEQALQSLDEFSEFGEFDSLLKAPLDKIRSTLFSTTEYVERTDHSLAWIGTVGIGKTTALSYLTNLLIAGSSGRPRPIFPTSAGRTTTSEVIVRPAPAFGVAVESKSEDEIILLVRELVDAIAGKRAALSTELERAIRNMTALPKRKDPMDPTILIDPVREMVEADPASLDDVVQNVVARMHLDQRTETQMIHSADDDAGLEWLSKVVTDINFGRDPRFSLPNRVTVFVPARLLRKSPFNLTIIDTKGIHGTTERGDLQAFNADPRALSILCCSFNDAPGQEPLKILRGLVEVGSDAIDRGRVVLLVLPRADEALKVISDTGEPVESRDEGYAFRTRQIMDTFQTAGIPNIPILFFNETEDNAPKVWNDLSQNVEIVRRRQLERLDRFTGLAKELQTNADAHRIQQARVTLAEEAVAIAFDYRKLPPSIRPPQRRLIREIKISHASTIAAAAVRDGSWYNLDMHHIVGAGVREDANLRTADLIKKIEGRLDGLRNKFASTPEAVALVDTLAEDLEDWRQEFLTRALSMGRNTYKPHLEDDDNLWAELVQLYGQGSGYRDRIADRVERWFEGVELNAVRSKIDNRLEKAWRELVLDNLVRQTSLDDKVADD
jgi:transcriptional regulator with XRE-family HTH domain